MAGVAVQLVVLVLVGYSLVSLGAPVEEQLRLSSEERERELASLRGSKALSSSVLKDLLPQQKDPESQLHWWQRWSPWRPEKQRTVRVQPFWANGTSASLVDLRLPQSNIDRELRPAGTGDEGLFNYNSSAMLPLIPWAWSWMSDLQQMQNRSNGFDIDVARRLSVFAAITYCDVENLRRWNCSRCSGLAAGFKPYAVVDDTLWHLLAYVGYDEPLNAIIVSFRGTDSHSLYNWAENMRTWRTNLHIDYPESPQGALVHGGFFTSYNGSALASNITQAVKELNRKNPRVPVYVVGHSLGGAMATICALDIRLNLGIEDVRLYTFGSPRVGNTVFAEWFRKFVKVRWRFTHNRDMVPSVPIQLMGFRHVAQEVWILELDGQHTLVGLCDESGEDPLCHNSMCYLGLCTSIGDHLLYLSEMYTPRPDGC